MKSYRLSGPRFLLLSMAVIGLLFLTVLVVLSTVPAAGHTRLELTDHESGRRIFSAVLRDGEEAKLSWRNSLFGLDVTEVFTAGRGAMILTQVSFSIPGGTPPPEVTPADVDDLYHTGGPFTARGLDKSIHQVTYRVSEIGNPSMKIRNRLVDFKKEVGFGGAITLSAASPSHFAVLISYDAH
ncbi:MAG: hypothetical protein AB9866_29710 [Syntrophobacteraceae bacterium]